MPSSTKVLDLNFLRTVETIMAAYDISQLFSVKGLVFVITGGGSGIGAWFAGALEANGAKVFILGRRQEALNRVAAQAVCLPSHIYVS